MSTNPLLTHDQLQAIARLADDASKGDLGDVRSLTVFTRPDGVATVAVNGQTLDFAMDEYGNPVQP